MSGEDEQFHVHNSAHNESFNEEHNGQTSFDTVLEISDDDDDDDQIDLSHTVEVASGDAVEVAAEDAVEVASGDAVEASSEVIFKTENEDAGENSLEAVDDNCNNDNLERPVLNPLSLAFGNNRKRKRDDSSTSFIYQSQKIGKFSSPNQTVQAASDVIGDAESSEDSMDSVILIKNELTASSVVSMSTTSYTTGSVSEVTTTATTNDSCNSAPRRYDYDLSRIKWIRPLNNLSSPPHLQIVIIDLSHPLWQMSQNKWLMIEKKLLEHLHDEMLRKDDNSIGLFDGAKWTRGIKVVGCGNQNSLDFITKFMRNNNNLWQGANLDVIPINQITRQNVRVFIPPPELSKSTILSFIKLQNPLIYCDDWEITREFKCSGGGRQLWININNDSYEHIRKLNGEIKFGINRIWFKPVY